MENNVKFVFVFGSLSRTSNYVENSDFNNSDKSFIPMISIILMFIIYNFRY